MELDEEHVVEEEGLKKEEMARVVGTCIGHTEPGRRVGAQSAPWPYCTRGPTPFKETKEKMIRKTLPKALRTQASTALPSNLVWIGGFGLVGLAQ